MDFLVWKESSVPAAKRFAFPLLKSGMKSDTSDFVELNKDVKPEKLINKVSHMTHYQFLFSTLSSIEFNIATDSHPTRLFIL